MRPLAADRRELPLSVYLRETQPTDFLNLLVWNRAAAPALWEEMLLHPINSFSSEETTDRVRVVERLFNDHNWSRINTVTANGQGETSIALIKDDIGNWNLKSFDSDTTELVSAYKDLTLAAVKTATEAVQAGATGGISSTAKSLLGTASQLTSGNIGGDGDVGGLDIENIHEDVETRLKNAANKHQAKFDESGKEGETEIQTQKRKAKASKNAIEEMRDIVKSHRLLIDALERAVVSNQPKAPAALAK